ncbi:MAG: hypothetical protein ACE5E9_08460 [Nitrospinaceae bacterium]
MASSPAHLGPPYNTRSNYLGRYSPVRRPMRSRWTLMVLGIFSLLLYFIMAQLSRQFNWGEGYADRPILTYLAVYFGLFLLYAIACAVILKGGEDRLTFWAVIGLGLLFRAVILPAHQIQEDDIYRYLWDGKVFAHGINPYEYAPAEVNDYLSFKVKDPENLMSRYDARQRQELALLNQLKWESGPGLKTLERVNHPEVPTIYPPMAQFVFRFAHFIHPDSIITMRLVFLGFDLIALVFIVRILSALGGNRNFSLIYFWSPLLIKETYNSTHLDIIGVAFLCAAIYCLIANRQIFAMIFLAFSFLGKFYSGVLFPLFLHHAVRQGRKRGKSAPAALLGQSLLFGGTVLLFYLPFIRSGSKTFEGLKTFSTYWQSNDSLFSLLVYFFGNVLRLNSLDITVFSNGLPTFLSKLIAALVVVGVMVYLLVRRAPPTDSTRGEVQNIFLLMCLVFLLSPVQNPWYLCWVLPFLCFFPWWSWILLTGLEGLYYLDFYFDYQEIQNYSVWIPWLEYTPFYILLFLELNRKGILRRNSVRSPAGGTRV